jgi:hypothetical protein
MTPNATKPVPFEAPVHLIDPAIDGLRWAKREVDLFGRGFETQYLVMREDDVNVLSSGFSPEHAAAAAVRMHAYLKRTPEHYFPRLIGFRFEANTDGPVVQHLCVSPNGEVCGSADLRESAARLANLVALSRLPVRQLSFDDFKQIAVCAEVTPGRKGTRDRPTLYTEVGGGEEIKKALDLIWTLEPHRHDETKADFIQRVERQLFNLDLLAGRPGASFEIPMGPGAIHLVVHHPRISRDAALRTAYAAAMSAGQESAHLEPAPTGRGSQPHGSEERRGGRNTMRQRA